MGILDACRQSVLHFANLPAGYKGSGKEVECCYYYGSKYP